MRFMLFICHEERVVLNSATRAGIPAAVEAWVEEMEARGVRREGWELERGMGVRAVRVRDGKVVIEQGPVTEGEELITGFDILECDGLDEALEIAAKHPVATFGTIEVRPYVEG